MVVAQIGLGYGIIKENLYAVVVFMSVATTIVAPPLINVAFKGLMKPGEAVEEDFRLGWSFAVVGPRTVITCNLAGFSRG